ncbi:antA/AntB antirepressor family protein [Clostridium sporogenes]|uniref:antA/AntB antirepressor family protein n=1 Tax=Clostridium sporogenes TaxID=1509 RepID=UPI001C11460D|nr:antA/AntB antirepressor family protein [Clostridium sporogenes]MBU5300474.1 antA/AntB antirepressor family protein [Clostridium sporogenes]
MIDLIKINYDKVQPTVSGRELHEFLEVKTQFKDWFPRMCEYGFTEGVDFNSLKIKQLQNEGSRVVKRIVNDYEITIPMAKELCMIQRTEKGKLARQYFISIESAWNTPKMIMSRAVKMADKRMHKLQIENSKLLLSNAIMQPKADYFDELADRNLLTNFRDTAKELGVRQKVFINYLLANKFVYRDGKGKLKPYANKNDGLFEIKEAKNDKNGWSGLQTLITLKGRETFRLLMISNREVSE